ncbi:hypothetical protein FB382_001144 [Nocardioides ginsengisegetis]|uniref:Uncharacterized protein n=1 Tax=Nocardioides ginsengisegetis TaxID=661491 RepID=A0A7W3IYA1_9ACTN|nr:hypothetical protein [Nocardioides ginsengisegetis]MBA8802853.1 hypothetical protein [Nocardioides ginsengisegetis]
MSKPSRRNRNATSPWPFVGMAGMACAFFLYAASGLVAPWWAVVLLLAAWLVLLLVCAVWWTAHPRWVPWVPVFAVVLWFGLLTAGGAWLGWTA